MYKLLNKLFGWDYIYWKNLADQGIAKVYKNADGKIYYFRYRTTNLIDTISKPEHVVWLTCSYKKYFPNA